MGKLAEGFETHEEVSAALGCGVKRRGAPTGLPVCVIGSVKIIIVFSITITFWRESSSFPSGRVAGNCANCSPLTAASSPAIHNTRLAILWTD
jgi:hypothetical protein